MGALSEAPSPWGLQAEDVLRRREGERETPQEGGFRGRAAGQEGPPGSPYPGAHFHRHLGTQVHGPSVVLDQQVQARATGIATCPKGEKEPRGGLGVRGDAGEATSSLAGRTFPFHPSAVPPWPSRGLTPPPALRTSNRGWVDNRGGMFWGCPTEQGWTCHMPSNPGILRVHPTTAATPPYR